MARARNLKPGFFNDAELVECEFWVRLLFAGLWTLADREGRLKDKPKQIGIDIFPADSVDVDAGLEDLERHGFLIRYEVAGQRYLQIRNFSKHQMPHYKEPVSQIPAPQGWQDSGVVATGPSAELRAAILRRDGKCLECGATGDLTLDHIVPRALGGTDDEKNLQTLCRRCNSAKNNRQASSLVNASSANDEPTSANDSGASRADSGLRTPDSPLLISETTSPLVRSRGRYSADFESLWSQYPPVTNNSKLRAWKAWERLSRSERADALAAIPVFVDSDGWRRGYAPHTSTFLNGKPWEDLEAAAARASPSPNGTGPRQQTPEEIAEFKAWMRENQPA